MPKRPDRRLGYIVVTNWVPALITAGIGGLVVSLLVPRMQTHFVEKSKLEERRVQLWESIGNDFTGFIHAQYQLREITKPGSARPTAVVLTRKEEYRKARDSHMSKLRKELVLAGYYFGSEVKSLATAFQEWHNQFRTAPSDQLPPDEQYFEWRDQILAAIWKDLEGELRE